MQWLERRQQERRWWSASAIVAVLGLVLGVAGVVPAFADLEEASCSVTETSGSRGLTISWTGVPDGLALVALAESADGTLTPVPMEGADAVGYGPKGTWQTAPVPGAVAYHLHADPSDGGGTLRCGGGELPDPGPPTSGETRLSATLVTDCDAAAVTVVVVNDGSAEGTADIAVDGTVTETVTVPAGERVTRSVPLASIDAQVAVLASGAPVATLTVDDGACTTASPDLSASIAVDCAADEIVVTVVNDGAAAGTATVEIDGAARGVEVAPGSIEVARIDRPANPTATVTVTAGTQTLVQTVIDTSCDDPTPELSATVALVCDLNAPSARVTVVNRGDAAGSVTVEVGEQTNTVEVAAGQERSIVVPVPGEGPMSVVVRGVDGAVLAEASADGVCDDPTPDPRADAVLVCESGRLSVTVGNDGEAPAVLVVEIDGRAETVSVPAAGEIVRTVQITPGSTIRVVVHDGQRTVLDRTFSDTCTVPAPAMRAVHRVDCAAEIVEVVVTNDGDAAGEVVVRLGLQSDVRRIAPGTSQIVAFPMPAAATRLVVETAGVDVPTTIVDTPVDPCDDPRPRVEAVAQVDCALGEVVVTITNRGDAPSTVTWRINGETATVTVAAGTDLVVSGRIVVGSDNVVGVVADGTTVLDQSVPNACVVAGPSLSAVMDIDCANQRIVVRVVNTGDTEGRARVVVNGNARDVTVAARDVELVAEPLPADGAYLVSVTSGDTELLTAQGTAERCDDDDTPTGRLAARVDFSCVLDEAVVQVDNGFPEPRVVTVTVDDDVRDVRVPPGETVELAYSLEEDEPYEISVVDENGGSLAFVRGVHDCVDVGGVTTTPTTVISTTPMVLASTGLNSGVLAIAGVTLVGAGLLATQASRMRRLRLADVDPRSA